MKTNQGDFRIKKDPLSITISLVYNLNLLEENKEYNINELKFITNLDNHWVTIQKYLNIFNIIQKYCPKIKLEDSKLRITKSKVYRKLTEKEKLILFLFNNQALDQDSAVNLPENFERSNISQSINYLFKKTNKDKYYLTKSGLELYRYFKKDLSDLIYNNKDIDDIFGKTEELLKSETDLSSRIVRITSEFPLHLDKPELVSILHYETSAPITLKGTNLIKRDDSTGSKLEIASLIYK